MNILELPIGFILGILLDILIAIFSRIKKGKIAHFKIPKYIWFVDEFPMTVTGKIQKYRMQEIAITEFKTHANVSKRM